MKLQSIFKNIASHGMATASLLAGSVTDALVYGIEQWNTPKGHLYDAQFGDLDRIASSTGNGWCITGTSFLKRRTEAPHMLCCGNSGSGKTSIIANSMLLNAKGDCYIVHDPSGTIMNVTAPYLKRLGYKVYVLDLNADPNYSDAINPFDLVTEPSDVGKVVSHQVDHALGDAPDRFWKISSVGVLRILATIVLKQPPEYRNYKNLQHLLFALSGNRELLFPLAAKYLTEVQFNEFVALLKSNERTLTSILMNCTAALELFNDDKVSRLTSISTLSFETFRKQPSVLYIKNDTMTSAFHKPILSTIVEGIIRVLMRNLPIPGEDNHVFFVLDECSSLSMDNLELVLANARKNFLNFCIFYQNISQIYNHLGKEAGTAVLANCHTKLFLNTDLKTSQQLEEALGKRTIVSGHGRKWVEPLMPAQTIRSLPRNEAILLYGEMPYRVKVVPYYEQPFLKMRASTCIFQTSLNNIPKMVPLLRLK